MKKESSQDSDSGDCQLTAATCFDHRTIILDWSGRKRGRLCKWRLAAQAQHTANAVDILESVNQYHDNKSLYDANMPSSMCEVHEKKRDLSDNRKSETPEAGRYCCWTNLQNCANGPHQDKSQTMVRIHGTQEIKNDRRQQREETSRLLQQATTQQVALFGKTTQHESFPQGKVHGRENPSVQCHRLCCTGHAYHDNPPVTHDNKLTTRFQISAPCAEQVRCTSN